MCSLQQHALITSYSFCCGVDQLLSRVRSPDPTSPRNWPCLHHQYCNYGCACRTVLRPLKERAWNSGVVLVEFTIIG